MTNVLALISVLLVTNRVESLHPSGQEKHVRTVVARELRTRATVDGRVVTITNRIPLSTNIVRMTWQVDPLFRAPLSLRDKSPLPPMPPKPKPKQ